MLLSLRAANGQGAIHVIRAISAIRSIRAVCTVQGFLAVGGPIAIPKMLATRETIGYVSFVEKILPIRQIMFCIVEDRMRVGSTISKRVHADTAHTIRWPGLQCRWDFNIPFVEENLRVPFLEVQIWRDQAFFEHEYSLDDTCDSGSRFEMANL